MQNFRRKAVLAVIIILIIFLLAALAIVVTIGGSKNRHEKEISDKAQIEYCGEIYKKSLKEKKK